VSSMPTGDAGRKYDEVCILVQAYAARISTIRMSYADLLRNIDRLTELGKEAPKLWGDK
jgi:hypothetical protein